MSLSPVKLDSPQSALTSTGNKDSSRSIIIAFLTLNTVQQEKALENHCDFENYIQALKNVDLRELFPFSHLSSYLINNVSLLAEGSLHSFPHALRFFMILISQILKTGSWPWDPLVGKSFLAHIKEYIHLIPQELGVQEYLTDLGEDAIALFEKIIKEKSQTYPMMIDRAQKINQLNTIKEDAKALEAVGFPGAVHFINEVEILIGIEAARLEKVEKLYLEMRDSPLPEKQKIKFLYQHLASDFFLEEAYRGYLALQNDFQTISHFINSSDDYNFSVKRIFREICIEKAKNIEMTGAILTVAAPALIKIWDLYYHSSAPIFRDSAVFNLEQQTFLDRFIQEKIICSLFFYMIQAKEREHFNHCVDLRVIPDFAVPSSLYLVKDFRNVMIPISVIGHQMGLHVTPEGDGTVSLSLYNTGYGTRGRHPETPDGLKIQTVMRKQAIPVDQLFNEEVWIKIHRLRHSSDIEALYALIFDDLGANGKMEPASLDSHDYEAPQHNGSCVYQHIQALIRDQFMECAELGSKRERYSTYKIIMSDFQLFVGRLHFPLESRDEIYKEKHTEMRELLLTWEEKEKKLQAIQDLVKSIPLEEDSLEYFCDLFDRGKKGEELSQDAQAQTQAFNAFKDTSLIYRVQRCQWTISFLTKIPLENLPKEASFCLRVTPFKEAILKIVKERLAPHPEFIAAFKDYLKYYHVKCIDDSFSIHPETP